MYQNGKTHGKHTLLRNKINLPKTCILNVFDLLTYKKCRNTSKITFFRETKEHCEKLVLCFFFFFSFLGTKMIKLINMKKRTTLPKTCISSLSDVITYNNTKMHLNYLIWRKERHYETRVLSVFFQLLRYQNIHTHE